MDQQNVKVKLQRLVKQLSAGTENGEIKWTETSEENAFRARLRGGLVRVQKSTVFDENAHDAGNYSLTVLDGKAKELEEYFPESEEELSILWSLAPDPRSTEEVLDQLLQETAIEETKRQRPVAT